MGLIKIISLDGIEIDFVKESLTIKKENNSFSTEFKVSHSSFPFLVIENKNTKKTLGNRDMTSLNKKKIVDVIIEESGVIYYGKIQQLTFLNGFRKCNLKYSSAISVILEKKLSELLPSVSVIPDEIDPIPYSEVEDIEVDGGENWQTFPLYFLDKSFPEVKFQFPKIAFKEKFGANLDPDDEWYQYQGFVNNYDDDGLILNDYVISGSTVETYNKNVASPQLYLLSILYYALKSIDYTITGDFYNNDFIKRLLVYSSQSNHYKPKSKDLAETFSITDTTWSIINSLSDSYTPSTGGKYRIEYEIVVPPSPWGLTWHKVELSYKKSGFGIPTLAFRVSIDRFKERVYKGFFEVNLSDGQSIEFIYYHSQTIRFTSNVFKIYDVSIEKSNLMHPTINLGRYTPDMNLATYFNELKKIFNLKIDVDDYKKEMIINFNENQIFNTPTLIKRSLKLDSFDIVANTSFILKYNNDTDLGIFVTLDVEEELKLQKDEFTKPISFGFKKIPHNGVTSELNPESDKKSGIGLMIYNPESTPYTSVDYLGKNLDINGEGGIYDIFFKKWIRFRLSASGVELSGSFTKTEVNSLNKTDDIYVDKQHYKIVSLEISEESETFCSVKLKLESVNL